MKSDVLVIGGGVVGLSVARELQTLGKSTVLIDRIPVGTGCSFANAGWVTPCFAMPLPQPGMFFKSMKWLLDSSSPLHIQPSLSPTLIRWLWRFMCAMNRPQMLRSIEVLTEISKYSLDFYSQLASRVGPSIQFEKRGLLMVSATSSGVQAAIDEMNLMAERGIPGRKLSRDEVLAFEPTLRPVVQGGVYFPEEAQLEPYSASLALAKEFESAGGKILPPAEAYDFTLQNGAITEVHTTQGPLQADLVVLATGSWSPELARRLNLNIPILGGKGYSMTLEGVSRKPTHSMMLVDRKIAVTPFPDRLRIAGTLELVNQDFSVSVSRLRAIYQGAHEYLDLGLKTEVARKDSSTEAQSLPASISARDLWRGLRPCTPDGVPLIGFSSKVKNLFYCTGHQMLGLQSAPGSARLASDLIFGRTPLTHSKPFSPARFE
ncbi:MAG: FAD-dependent oxidoreductase [Bdellovibrionales bacterium]|nr:FAD-dependent oxidoreductase [Bdellovibrionales bacterium]